MRPAPFFATRARRGRKKLLLAIGPLEEDGPTIPYLLEEEGLHSQVTHLQRSSGSYGIWRAYMKELVEIEEGDWDIESRDLPRRSDVAAIYKKMGRR